jgi:hypothetical protein
MKTPAGGLAASLLALSIAGTLAVRADQPGAPGSPTPPERPSFTADPPGTEATPAPTPDEWKAAPAVTLDHDVAACRAYRVREWVKLHCGGFPAAGVTLLAGTRTGVAVWVDPPRDPAETMKTPRAAEAIFPVRRGDGRLFQVGQFGEGYDGPVAWNLAFTVSEQWLAAEAAPVISVR